MAVQTHPFLHGMRPEHVELLAANAMLTEFDPGQIIFHAGEIANRFYLIEQGAISIETPVREEGVITLQTLGGGDVLGWSWLFAPYYWHFSACALESSRAVFFYGTRLREICEENRQFGYELMRRVAAVAMQRLQQTLAESLRLAGMRPLEFGGPHAPNFKI
jgi:CRP/FNR family transcriptional regulator, cyclic AMP receptor protein